MANHGGVRQGAGRKSRADELKVAEKFRNILSDDDVVNKLAEKVNAGDMKAIELWLAYVIGKPKDKIDVTTGGEKINIPISEWVKTKP
jgi:hypothetical protein